MALRRIQKEYMELTKAPFAAVTAAPKRDDMLHWEGVLAGPSNSPYKNGFFKFDIVFSTDYPFKPPKVKFITKIYHPNIDDNGAVCIALLKSEVWKPATKLLDVFNALINIISEPNPDDPLVSSIAEQFKVDRPAFNKTAEEWVKQYATQSTK